MSKYKFVLAKPNSKIRPYPRSGHRCVTDGVFLYVFGGFNMDTNTKLFPEIWCFNLSLQTWQMLDTARGLSPKCVASSTIVLKRGKLIVFGGSGYPFGTDNSNLTYICDLHKKTWEVVFPDDNLPDECYGHSAVVGPENHMYVFGGSQGLLYNNDLHKMSLDSYSWERIQSTKYGTPSPRYRHEAVGIDGGFLVLGGYGHQGACPLDKVFIFSYSQSEWTEIICHGYDGYQFPKPRRAHSCVEYNNGVYICGGYSEMDSHSDEPNAFNDVWRLDLRTFSWFRIDQVLPFPRFFHSAAVTSTGCMYIFGGVQQTGRDLQERTNNVYKMWLVIPPLLELCWEKLCKIFSASSSFDTRKLAKLGVPRHLVARCKST